MVMAGGEIVGLTGRVGTNISGLFTGAYAFEALLPGNTYTIEPHKNTNTRNGVNIFDVYLVQQHIAFIEPLEDPYKLIAADVNASGNVSILDMFYMQDLIVINADTFPNNESWRFIPEAFLFPNSSNPFATTFPETLDFVDLEGDALDQHFIGIKRGDGSQNANPLLLSNDADTRTSLDLVIRDHSVIADETIEVGVTAANFNSIAAFQFDLFFDVEKLEFLNVVPGDIPGASSMLFGQRFVENGTLAISWFDVNLNAGGVEVDSDEVLFTLSFKAKTDFLHLGVGLDLLIHQLVCHKLFIQMERILM